VRSLFLVLQRVRTTGPEAEAIALAQKLARLNRLTAISVVTGGPQLGDLARQRGSDSLLAASKRLRSGRAAAFPVNLLVGRRGDGCGCSCKPRAARSSHRAGPADRRASRGTHPCHASVPARVGNQTVADRPTRVGRGSSADRRRDPRPRLGTWRYLQVGVYDGGSEPGAGPSGASIAPPACSSYTSRTALRRNRRSGARGHGA